MNVLPIIASMLVTGIVLFSPVIVQSSAAQSAPQDKKNQSPRTPETPANAEGESKPSTSPKSENHEAQVGQQKPPFSVSKETTFATGPLTKHGFIDYRAAINQHFSQGVTPENNAVIPLVLAIGPHPDNSVLPDAFFDRLGIKPLPDEGEYFSDLREYTQRLAENANPPQEFDTLWKDVEKQWSRTLEAPWQAKDFPIIDSWLQENEKPLAIVVQGTKRPRYFHPWVAIGDEPLYAQSFAMIQSLREVARKLSMRSMRKIGEGDLDGAWEDQMAMHRLARLLSQGPTLIDMLVGIAINGIACHDCRVLAQHESLTAEQARRMQQELANLRPFRTVECVNFGERLSSLDVAQTLARHPGKEVDALVEIYNDFGDPDGLPERQVAALNAMLKTTPIRWDDVLRNFNGRFDRLVEAMLKPGYEEREAALADEFADLDKSAELWTNLPEIAKTFPMGIKNPDQWMSEHVANGLAVLLIPAIQACTQAETRSASSVAATRLAFALAAYRLDHGKYPKKLEQLAPKYIDAVPKDPLGNDIEYSSDAKGYTVRIPDPAKIIDIVVASSAGREE